MNFLETIESDPGIDRFVDRSFDIVDRIHEIIKSEGLSQRDVAKLLGKKESEISKWFSGMHNFTLKSLMKLEVVLGKDIIHVASDALPETNLNKRKAEPNDRVAAQAETTVELPTIQVEVTKGDRKFSFPYVNERFTDNPVDCATCMDGIVTPYFGKVKEKKELEEVTYA